MLVLEDRTPIGCVEEIFGPGEPARRLPQPWVADSGPLPVVHSEVLVGPALGRPERGWCRHLVSF